ncbi:MAG: hypothetical protein K9K88_10395 [Desulfobacterales bacterium]|nr:hypothetical protein [Desulfobacterales bacterium]
MNHLLRCATAVLAALICAMAWRAPGADGAFLYKSYRVQIDRGREILCDPYIVQKNDYVLKLLRQKGEIAAEDFPEFLAIFQRINPHIRDINLVRPGQQISIPLRVLRSNEMPGQSSGVVTIAYVTIGSEPEEIKRHTDRYLTKSGDCVSKLIASRFGRYGTDAYREGVRLFRRLNPAVTDLDLIYAGQVLRLPKPSARDPRWYAKAAKGAPDPTGDTRAAPGKTRGGARAAAQAQKPQSPLKKAAEALGAELLDRGAYFFPRQDSEDFRLDLSRVPAMRFADGRMALLPQVNSSEMKALEALDSVLERVDTVPLSPDWAAVEIVQAVLDATGRTRPMDRLVVSDGGVRMEIHARWITGRTIDDSGAVGRVCIIPIEDCTRRTPGAIARYLEEHDILLREICKTDDQKGVRGIIGSQEDSIRRIDAADRRSFVQEVLTEMGCHYSPSVNISFPYAGVQVSARSNLAAAPGGREFLVDFGDLYGDAIAAIERAGFSIVQVPRKDRRKIMLALLEAADLNYRVDPIFMAADRPGPYNVAVTISGVLVETENDSRLLLSAGKLHHRIADFLRSRGVRIVEVGYGNEIGAS